MAFNLKSKTIVNAVAVAEKANDTGVDTPAETQTEVVNTDSEGETQRQKALAFASRESDDMATTANVVANAKEDWQGGPIKLLFALRETYGDDIDDMPQPGMDTGNNRDKFKVAMEVNGVTSVRSTTWYHQFVINTKEGKTLVEEMAWLKRLANVNDKKDGIPSPIIDAYLDDEDKRETRYNYLDNRLKAIKSAYVKSMSLYYQMDAVASLKHVNCDFDYITENGENTGEVENTPKPIMIWERPPEGKPISKKVTFSVGSFLKLNAKIAAENGGTLKALLQTVARDTNNKDSKFPTIKTAETFTMGFVELFRAMDEFQSSEDQKEIGKFMKLLNNRDAAELKVSVIEFRNYLDDICSELKLGQWYADLQAKRDPLVTRKAS